MTQDRYHAHNVDWTTIGEMLAHNDGEEYTEAYRLGLSSMAEPLPGDDDLDEFDDFVF